MYSEMSIEEDVHRDSDGQPEAKINEYQAAWNVTNAIQVENILNTYFFKYQLKYLRLK